MKIIFTIEDMERIYNRVASEAHGYLDGKLDKANTHFEYFYGNLDTVNRDNFMRLVGLPEVHEVESYAFEKLSEMGEDFTLQYIVPNFDGQVWSADVHFTMGDSYRTNVFSVWYEPAGLKIYGEW